MHDSSEGEAEVRECQESKVPRQPIQQGPSVTGAPPRQSRAAPIHRARVDCEKRGGPMSYGVIHQFTGGTESQYEASIGAVHPADGSLPAGQISHVAGPSADGWVVV